MNVISSLCQGDRTETIYQCRESFQHLPVKLNVKVIKPRYAPAPTSVIKERCKWVTLIVRGCTPSFPVQESNHDSMPNEFIKGLKILRDSLLGPGYITEVRWGLHAQREEKKTMDEFLEAYLFSLRREGGGQRKWSSLFWEISKWNHTFLILSLVWPFQEEECERGEDRGLCEFYGTWFQTFALLSSREIKGKTLYEIFITFIPISLQRMTTETLRLWIIPRREPGWWQGREEGKWETGEREQGWKDVWGRGGVNVGENAKLVVETKGRTGIVEDGTSENTHLSVCVLRRPDQTE